MEIDNLNESPFGFHQDRDSLMEQCSKHGIKSEKKTSFLLYFQKKFHFLLKNMFSYFYNLRISDFRRF